ncbi:MAG: YraN family protein [Actinomycetota bacterium]|nr:YraN family protein [Actinomycetota bacterium]
MDTHLHLGRTGEDAAEQLYRRRGFTIVARNRRDRTGELDLIARRGDLLVFCEVKTRRSDRWGTPSEAVGGVKQHRLKRLAARYLAEEKPGPVDIRFDVVSVIVRGARTEITHIPDAF